MEGEAVAIPLFIRQKSNSPPVIKQLHYRREMAIPIIPYLS